MTTARQNYFARKNFIKKCTIVRNICVVIGILCFILGLGEYTGTHYMLFYGINLALLIIANLLIFGIEYFVLSIAIFDGDIDFKPIFAWNYKKNRMSYVEFLKHTNLIDSDKSFAMYRKASKNV